MAGNQFRYILADERNRYSSLLRPERINDGTNPKLKSTIDIVDGATKIFLVTSELQLNQLTIEFGSNIRSGNICILHDPESLSTKIFFWINKEVTWQEIELGSSDLTTADIQEAIDRLYVSQEEKNLISVIPTDANIDSNKILTENDIDNIFADRTIKEVVFVLGDVLLLGSQYLSEIWFPYSGTIQKIFIHLGEESVLNTDLEIGLELQEGSNWINKQSVVIEAAENLKKKQFAVDIPIESNSIRMNLINGDYSLIKNMSTIVQIKI